MSVLWIEYLMTRTNYEIHISVRVRRQKIWSDVVGIKCSGVDSLKENTQRLAYHNRV